MFALVVLTYTESKYFEQMCQKSFGIYEKKLQSVLTLLVILHLTLEHIYPNWGLSIKKTLGILIALFVGAFILLRHKFKDCSPLLGLMVVKVGMILSDD